MALQPDIQYVPFYYVEGNTARKAERRAAPAKAAPVPAPKRRRSRRKTVAIDPVAISGLLAVVVLLCAIMVSFVQYGLSAQRNARMSQYISQLESEQAQLQQQYEAGYDLDDIRDIAGALGMIPAEDAPQIQIDVTQPQQQEQTQLSFWESIATFLAGLFA